MDPRVVRFLTRHQYGISELLCPLEEKVRMIEDAISTGSKLEISYLEPRDEKSQWLIEPKRVGRMEKDGRAFIGVESEDNVFRVDWILGMRAR
jgi:hypothetical protein